MSDAPACIDKTHIGPCGEPDCWAIVPSSLFHFTCADHGYKALGKGGMLVPHWHPLLRADLLWLTTEAHPDREASGLGMTLTSCDRMAYRYVVTYLDGCVPWLWSEQRRNAPQQVVADLESFGDPEHWWVSDRPVEGRLG